MALRKPNIIFVFTDQMRASALGCLGIENVTTPNLDAFAGEGTLFTRAISNHPVCCPARATLITGLHSINHGLVVNDQQISTDNKSIAHYLNGADYKCGYIGKWHLDCLDRGAFIPPGPRRMGFDDLWAVNQCNHDYMKAYYYLQDNSEPVWIEGYEPKLQTDLAVNYISKKVEEDTSFCLFLSWGPPHCPYREVPQKYLDMYPYDSIKLKPNAPDTTDKSDIAGYYAHITALDEQFGRLLKALEDNGLTNNTIVIFTSDHGDMLFSQNHGWKSKPWSEAVNIPFIARWPGKIPAGRRCNIPIGIVDIMPTLLGLAGIDTDTAIDGNNLSNLFLGDEKGTPQSQFIYSIIAHKDWTYKEWRGIVTQEYTYARFKDKYWVLYNDLEDPYQLNNLIDNPEYLSVREQLNCKLKLFMDNINDPFYSSDEAVEAYVANKIIVSGDKDELTSDLLKEYALLKSHGDLDNSGNIIESLDENRVVRYFENRKINMGKEREK